MSRKRKQHSAGLKAKVALAVATGMTRRGPPWRIAKTLATHCGMSKEWLQAQGLVFLRYVWSELAPLRRTA